MASCNDIRCYLYEHTIHTDWDKWDGEKDETPEDGNDPEADGNDPEAENDPEQGTGDSAATTTAANDDEGHANTDEQQDFNVIMTRVVNDTGVFHFDSFVLFLFCY